MILEKGQSLDTELMFREAGETWPVTIPEEEIRRPAPSTKLHRGNRVISVGKFEFEKVLTTVERKVTHLWVVPPVMIALAKQSVVMYNLALYFLGIQRVISLGNLLKDLPSNDGSSDFGFDKLYFNVLEVNKTSYENCIDRDFIKNITKGGRDVFNLIDYFLSSGGYCFNGMKLSINVKEFVPTPAPSPSQNGAPPNTAIYSLQPTIIG